MLRAVLFDFDGLILDTEWPEVLSWREVFAAHGEILPDDIWRGAIGRGVEQEAVRPADLLSRLSGIGAEELRAEYQALRMSRILAQPVLPGILDLMVEARELGMRVAVVSSSARSWVEGHLERLGLLGLVERTFTSDDVARTKPSPDLYLLALREFGIVPGEGIAFEDSENGVAAAHAAGIPVIACPNPATMGMDFSKADRLVGSLSEVSLTSLGHQSMSPLG